MPPRDPSPASARSPSPSPSPSPLTPLPSPPRIELTRAGCAIAARREFLRVDPVDLVAKYPDGATSEPFPYDAVLRRGMDAVVLVAYRVDGGERRVYMRTALRPPLGLRFDSAAAGLWELPAGIIDPGESPRDAGARELEEELGFTVDASALTEVGGWTYPAPAIIAEKHYFFAVDVSGLEERTPTEDGSPLERGAHILHLPLRDLLEHCRRGALPDAKTELALRRFAEVP